MPRRSVHEELIRLVRDHPEVLLTRQFEDVLDRLAAVHGAGRVVRRVEDDRPRTRSDLSFETDSRGEELVLGLSLDENRNATAKKDLLGEADPIRRRNEDLVSG